MIKPAATKKCDAVASATGSISVSSPVYLPGDDPVSFVQKSRRFPEMAGPNNPVLVRAEAPDPEADRISRAAASAGKAALLASAVGMMGCAGQGDVTVIGIALAWGFATVGTWGGVLLALNKLAGWFSWDRVSEKNISQYIKKGEWERICEALLDEGSSSKQLARIQAAVLAAYDKIPVYVQIRICKAIAMADGDSKHAIKAIDWLLKGNRELEQIMYALADIMLTYQEHPNGVAGAYIAKKLVKMELSQKQSVKDPMLALAVALTSDQKDCETLVGILATRVKLGFAQRSDDLIDAIRWLRRKPFGPDLCRQSLLPLLADIEEVDVGV